MNPSELTPIEVIQSYRPLKAVLALVILGIFYLPECLADLQVNERKDIVVLVDGKKIECNVVMVTRRGALVIVKEKAKGEEQTASAKQVLIPRARIKKIIRGTDKGRTKGFQTDVEQARKVVKGTGFRKKKKKRDDIDEIPDLPTGPIKKAQPLLPSKVLKPGINQPVTNSKQTPKELAEAYLTRFPALKRMTKAYVGSSSAVAQILKKAQSGNPILRAQVKGLLDILLHDSTAQNPKSQGSAKTQPGTPPPQPKAP